ncbi:MAG: indolepyruvate oxidoreductase subunit beta [Elusimicrobiaceae bacterium]
MKKDIVLTGVGGQGAITIAVAIVEAAIKKGLNFRQSEVHGMSQRGGAVETHVRISDGAIHCEMIPRGRADILISVEPLEALRGINYLSEKGIVITAITPVKNIPDYPPIEHVFNMLAASGRKVYTVDAQAAALEAGNPKAQNIALTGAASAFIGIAPELLRESVARMFMKKGEAVVASNLKAFDLGKTRAVKLES